MNTTPRHARISTALALAIIVGVIGFAVYVWLMRSAVPARGMTMTWVTTPILVATVKPALRPVAWFMAQKDYAAPLASSCAAPGPCGQETQP